MVITSIHNFWPDQFLWQRMQIRASMAPKTAVAIGESITEFVEAVVEYSNIKNSLGSGKKFLG